MFFIKPNIISNLITCNFSYKLIIGKGIYTPVPNTFILSLIEESKTGEKVEENTAADKPAAAIPANFLGMRLINLLLMCVILKLFSLNMIFW